MGRWRSLPAESETTSATIASSRFFPGAILYSHCTGNHHGGVVVHESALEIGSQVVVLDRWIGQPIPESRGKKSTPEKGSNTTSAISRGNLRGNCIGLMLFYSRSSLPGQRNPAAACGLFVVSGRRPGRESSARNRVTTASLPPPPERLRGTDSAGHNGSPSARPTTARSGPLSAHEPTEGPARATTPRGIENLSDHVAPLTLLNLYGTTDKGFACTNGQPVPPIQQLQFDWNRIVAMASPTFAVADVLRLFCSDFCC
jgi:hypothetical protein